MPLSWNEIRQRAITFSRAWSDAARERAEAQTFWNEFFAVFGKSRRAVASFEEPVKNLRGDTNFIDLFWPGRLIAEHKSRGGNLAKAHTQAVGYIHSLEREGRADESPRYILVCDFTRIALHDLEPPPDCPPAEASVEFPLTALHEHIRRFAFLAGYEARQLDPEDPANLKAAALLANLHDRLEDGGYAGHDLQRFMVRVLFCLFADDTGIFEPDAFKHYITHRTGPDGSDLGIHLARIFEILNTPKEQRQRTLDEDLAELPYVNGRLFAEQLRFADFDAAMRTALLECCRFKWETISPAVFGSLFQSIMEPRERRQIGAHYTSERDILKLIRSLFLDDLRDRLAKVGKDRSKLDQFLRDLGELRFLDPACGCGNFLVLAYRELRRIEMDAISARYGEKAGEGEVRAGARLNVEQFYGIEIEEWPALIAEVAMWLMDHQMNNELFARFGSATASVPLKKSPTIIHGNALRIDWNTVLPAKACSYVMGNPPFVGKKARTSLQNEDMRAVFGAGAGVGTLDYVCCWYAVAARYVSGHHIDVAFVSTNSITQGEQPASLWPLLHRHAIEIQFAHRTFPWESEAQGKAHVHVVIIGFGARRDSTKRLYDYDARGKELGVAHVGHISPYLADGSDTVVANRTSPLCKVPEMVFGSMPNDDGHLLLSDEDRARLIREDARVKPLIRPLISASQFLNGESRWCLWLVDAEPALVRSLESVRKRVTAVKAYREASRRPTTKALARTPGLFGEIRQPSKPYLLVPRHSSERRDYIPMALFKPTFIVSDSCMFIPNATLYHFGVLHSAMHMAWVRQVCGRLKSDYRYSAKLVYNNFPWPAQATAGQQAAVEQAAQGVLDARAAHPGSTLADLYDPLTMPADLAAAHRTLDRAVDRCYRPQPFPDERRRFEHLFALYEKLTAPLTAGQGRRRRA